MMLRMVEEKFAKALLLPINTSAVVILGIYAFVWGLWVANPWWDVFPTRHLYDAMNSVMPEYLWGIASIIAGLFTIYGAVTRKYNALLLGASISTIFWLIISIFYFIGDYQQTGGITAAAFSLYASYVYTNIKVNYRPRKKGY